MRAALCNSGLMKTVFVVLFRGVGGATQLPTGPLRVALADAGFENVATYINSGNAVVRSPWAAERSHRTIVSLARDLFGFEKDVFLRSRAQWRGAVAGNPYPEADEKPTSVHVFTLERAPAAGAVEALRARLSPGERIHVEGDTMYMHTPAGFGTSKTPPLIDRLLGMPTTARNWNSARKLLELADKADG